MEILFHYAIGDLDSIGDMKLSMEACLAAAGYSVSNFRFQMDAAEAELVKMPVKIVEKMREVPLKYQI